MSDNPSYAVCFTKEEANMLIEAIEQYYFMVGVGEEELSIIYEELREVASE